MTANVQKCRILLKLITRNDIVFNCGRRLLHEGPDTVEELLDRHVVKKEKHRDDEEEELQESAATHQHSEGGAESVPRHN
ncbi:hypothetical protein ACFX2A_016354 [Malus domestica]